MLLKFSILLLYSSTILSENFESLTNFMSKCPNFENKISEIRWIIRYLPPSPSPFTSLPGPLFVANELQKYTPAHPHKTF